MDPTKVIYAAAASSSLDSWEFENLHYIRRLSKTHPPLAGFAQSCDPTVSYISEQNEEELEEPETISLPFLVNQECDPAGPSSEGSSKEKCDEQRQPGEEKDRLEDCYLLDVVTVRNESVLAFNIQEDDQEDDKNKGGCPVSPNQTASCSAHPFQELLLPEARGPNVVPEHYFHQADKGFFDMTSEDSSSHSEASVVPTLLLQQRSHYCLANPRAHPHSCLFHNKSSGCCGCGMRNLSDIHQFPFEHCQPYEKDEESHMEDVSMQVTIGEETPAIPPRSPSPYYVRLRRDLLSALQNISPPRRKNTLTRPENFTVNMQGQLAIDYSSNWLCLENYVKNRKR